MCKSRHHPGTGAQDGGGGSQNQADGKKPDLGPAVPVRGAGGMTGWWERENGWNLHKHTCLYVM